MPVESFGIHGPEPGVSMVSAPLTGARQANSPTKGPSRQLLIIAVVFVLVVVAIITGMSVKGCQASDETPSEPTLREVWTQQLESARQTWSPKRPCSPKRPDCEPTWPQDCNELLGYSTTEEPYATKPLPPVRTLVSGGFKGADVLFGAAAAKAKHSVVHILGPFNAADIAAIDLKQPLCRLKPAQFDHDKVYQQWSDVMAKRNKKWAEQDYMSLRNLFQVQDVDAVYAVAYRAPPAKEQPAVPMPMDIAGGTGLAAQAYVNRFETEGTEGKLWFFDDCDPDTFKGCLFDPKTNKKWSQWNFKTREWSPSGDKGFPTDLPGDEGARRYAGIGGQFLNLAGKTAIGKLYEMNDWTT